MDMSTHTMASVSTLDYANEVFDFYSLPRELRDMVYDNLWQDVEEGTDDFRFNICTTIPKLRLVSRQFKVEYDEHNAAKDHRNEVTITQFYNPSPCDVPDEGSLPNLATRFTSFTFNIINRDENCYACHKCTPHKSCEHPLYYLEWVNHWLRARCPSKSLRINLSIASRRCVPEAVANHSYLSDLGFLGSEPFELNIFGPGPAKDGISDPVLVATCSGFTDEDKADAMLKLANEMAGSLGEPLWS
jgi:hypothetical protein